MLKEHIKTIKNFGEFTLKEKSSEFIAKVYPVENEQEALNELHNIRKKYFDATHHCFAYRINYDLTRFSDDGEPTGTAGIRILNAIEHFDIVNVLITVIRYFGGTKLGVGPLGKAYYNAAYEALKNLKVIELSLFQKIIIDTGFDHINHIHRTIKQYSGQIVNTTFSDKVVFECFLKPGIIDRIKNELTNLSGGQIIIEIKNEYQYKEG
jgi:uncharacterized YigZ family protein